MADTSSAPSPDDRDLSLSRLIDATPDKIWRAWTEPELLKAWFAPAPYTTPVAELGVRVGGASLIVMMRRSARDSGEDALGPTGTGYAPRTIRA